MDACDTTWRPHYSLVPRHPYSNHVGGTLDSNRSPLHSWFEGRYGSGEIRELQQRAAGARLVLTALSNPSFNYLTTPTLRAAGASLPAPEYGGNRRAARASGWQVPLCGHCEGRLTTPVSSRQGTPVYGVIMDSNPHCAHCIGTKCETNVTS